MVSAVEGEADESVINAQRVAEIKTYSVFCIT